MTSEELTGRDSRWSTEDVFFLAAITGLCGAFLFEIITVSGVPFARDAQLFFLPQKRIVWEAMQRGDIPLWTSLIGSGHPVLANFQSGIFYPPHWIFAVTPFLAGFNWLISLHILLGGAGMYLFCREIRFEPAPALLAAVAFMLGGYFISLTNLVNALQTAAWAPLMLFTLIRQVRRPGPGRFALMIGVYVLAFLAGAPDTFVLAAIVAGVYGIVAVSYPRATRDTTFRLAGTLVVAAATVAAIAMIQILPTLKMMGESTRASGLPLSQATSYALDPVRLVHLVFPNDFSDPTYRYGHKLQITAIPPWLYSVYLGVVSLVLSLQAGRDRPRRREVVCWTGLAVVGVLLALGSHTPLFSTLYDYVPGFSAFRYPEKFLLLTGFSVPMLAAHGLASMRREETDAVSLLAVILPVTAALAIKLSWVGGKEEIQSFIASAFPDLSISRHLEFAYQAWGANLDQLLILFVAAVLLIALYRRGHLRWRLFAALVVVLATTDFWLAHRQLIPVVDPSFYRNRPAIADVLPMEEVRTSYRYRATTFERNSRDDRYFASDSLSVATEKWFAQQTIQPNLGALHDILTLGSGGAIHLKLAGDRRRTVRQRTEPYRWRMMKMSSVKYLYSPYPHDGRYYEKRTALDSLPGFLYEVSGAVPRSYLTKGVFVPDEGSAMEVVLDTARSPGRPVVMIGDTLGRPPDVFRTWSDDWKAFGARSPAGPRSGTVGKSSRDDVRMGDARIVEDRGSKVRVRVDATRPGFLVLTDTYYPGWSARVDGEARPVLRANYFFRAVPIVPGDDVVTFRYRSRPLKAGAWISGGGLLLLVAVLLGWHRRSARIRRAGAETDDR